MSSQRTCPRCHNAALDTEAYAELLGWYLGDGHLARGRGEIWVLVITNDARYVNLNQRLLDLMQRVKPHGHPNSRRRLGCVATQIGWVHWPCLFPQHGPGRKHERPIVLDPWQEQIVRKHPGALLRGLFHSDGARVNNWATRVVAGAPKRFDYPRWQFSNRSDDIHAICQGALDLLGIAWRRSSPKHTSVSTRAGVARLDATIGLKS